jgi:hypothetical protein
MHAARALNRRVAKPTRLRGIVPQQQERIVETVTMPLQALHRPGRRHQVWEAPDGKIGEPWEDRSQIVAQSLAVPDVQDAGASSSSRAGPKGARSPPGLPQC